MLEFDRPMVNIPTPPMDNSLFTDGSIGVWNPNGGAATAVGNTLTVPMDEINVSAGDDVCGYTGTWIVAADGAVLQPFSGFPCGTI